MEYKIIDIETGDTVDQHLTYDESMLYSGDADVIVLEQGADSNKALNLLQQIRG